MARRKGWSRLNKRSQPPAISQTDSGNSPAAQIGEISTAAPAHDQPQQDSGTATASDPAASEGSGGRNARDEHGMTRVRGARLRDRAIREGWIAKHEPWGLNRTAADLEKLRIEQGGLLTMQQRAEVAIMQDLNGTDGRLRQIAVKSVVTMRGQELGDEHHAERMDFHERALAARTTGQARGGVAVQIGGTGGAPGLDGVGAGGTMPGVMIYIPHNGRDEIPGLVDGLSIDGLADEIDGPALGDDQEFRELSQSLEG